jgi:hypothetical protein
MNDQNIPKDPVILLSFVNMKLRDECPSLEMLCERYEISEEALNKKLNAIGYFYVAKQNQFK